MEARKGLGGSCNEGGVRVSLDSAQPQWVRYSD